MNNQQQTEYDVVIVGAGMVGAALACVLGQAGLRIALVEKSIAEPFAVGQDYDLRVSAISLASENILSNIGAWHAIQALRISPYREMYVWDAIANGHIHFDSAALQADYLGHIIENRVIQTALFDVLQAMDSVKLITPAIVKTVSVNAESVELQFKDADNVTAQLLVGADGAQSQVRQLMQMAVQAWEYQQHAVVAVVSSQHAHQATAWQRFLPDGPLAFLPLADGRCSIVWSTTPEHAEQLLALSADDFCLALSDASAQKLGAIQTVGPRATFPLHYLHANEYVKPRVALVGDAAHVVHPLAGQGVNLGFMDIAQLAEFLIPAYKNKKDLGSYKILRRYERYRKADNQLMALSLDGLKRLFGTDKKTTANLRSAGLNLANHITPVKQLLMQQAMGIYGDNIPSLAKALV